MILRAKFDGKRKAKEKADGTRELVAASPAAKNLAMAHHVDRLIEKGLISDYTHAARMFGVSQPRMTHLMSLLLLAPQVQEAILLGQANLEDKRLRQIARLAEWPEQLSAL